MAITRGTALVATVLEVAQLTGMAGLDNLSSSELVLTDVLVTASDTIHDRLKGDGVDPALLNADPFKRAVAYQFLAILSAVGHVRTPGEDPDITTTRFVAMADRAYKDAPVDTTSGDEPRSAGEALPAIGNLSELPNILPHDGHRPDYWERWPDRRT